VTGCASRHQPKASEHVIGLHVPIDLDKAGGIILATGCRLIVLTHIHTDHTSKFNKHFYGRAPSRLRLHPRVEGGDGGEGAAAQMCSLNLLVWSYECV